MTLDLLRFFLQTKIEEKDKLMLLKLARAVALLLVEFDRDK